MKMKVKRKQAVMLGLIAVFAVLLAITMLTGKPSADGEYTSTVYATALSLLPPVIAIGLALLQKRYIHHFWPEFWLEHFCMPMAIWN